jgi:hypothetical protein
MTISSRMRGQPPPTVVAQEEPEFTEEPAGPSHAASANASPD